MSAEGPAPTAAATGAAAAHVPGSVAGLPTPGRTLVMGVVNVTPDSFSDGGRWQEPLLAVEHGLDLHAQGADMVDVGGESTRPGATRPLVAEELDRVVPVIADLARAGVRVSVDTMRAEVADRALAAGAVLVNDVSGGLADPDMLGVVAQHGAAYVAMHWRAHSSEMRLYAQYDDVVTDVCRELGRRVEAAVHAGVDESRIAIDPGVGFAKTSEHNWRLLAALDEVARVGPPVLVGVSRKGFLGDLLADEAGPRPVDRREAATVALSALVAQAGVWCVRVHEVAANLDAVAVGSRLRLALAETPGAAPEAAPEVGA